MKRPFPDTLRLILQLGFLAAAILVPLCTDFLSAGRTHLTTLFICLVLVANLFFGKLFCSHLCPIGLFSELSAKAGKRISGRKREIKRWSLPDKILRSLKYILMALMLHGTQIMTPAMNYTIGISLVIATTLLCDMFFCRYICLINGVSNIVRFTAFAMAAIAVNLLVTDLGFEFPLDMVLLTCGYILEITHRKAEYNLSLLHVHRNPSNCTQCGKCSEACPFSVEIKNAKRIVDIECNLCGECVKACSRDALKMGICNTRPGQNRIRGVWFAPLITLVLLAIAVWIILQ